MANTKLTDSQKQELKQFGIHAEMENIQTINLDDKTVMAYKVLGNTVGFALSVMAPTETKFRAKVGRYYALQRFFDNQTVKMGISDFMEMCEFVWDAYPI